MATESAIDIRVLHDGDLAAAARLGAQEDWNQTESDWRRVLSLDRRGSFAASVHGRLIGTVTTVTYGAELAWIGMMLVDADRRRRGIGTRLMRTALDHLEARGVPTVKLDATPAGRPLYESLGFVPETRIERWEGTARPTSTKDVRELDRKTRDAVCALDRLASGADRSSVLEGLITGSCVNPQIVTERFGTELRGYALARSGRAAVYLGPVIATDDDAARALVDGMLGRLAGETVFVDLHTGFVAGTKILTDRGFSRQRELTRMRLGRENGAGTSSTIFAIAGPEIG
jgi:GNAT superfamily N-acetyltransferase